jgi:hypothetical protein
MSMISRLKSTPFNTRVEPAKLKEYAAIYLVEAFLVKVDPVPA